MSNALDLVATTGYRLVDFGFLLLVDGQREWVYSTVGITNAIHFRTSVFPKLN